MLPGSEGKVNGCKRAKFHRKLHLGRRSPHSPAKNNQSGVGSGMDNLGQWGLGLGDAGFGVLSPCNYGSQEEADEGADEKTDYEGNHFSFSFSK